MRRRRRRNYELIVARATFLWGKGAGCGENICCAYKKTVPFEKLIFLHLFILGDTIPVVGTARSLVEARQRQEVGGTLVVTFVSITISWWEISEQSEAERFSSLHLSPREYFPPLGGIGRRKKKRGGRLQICFPLLCFV